LIGAAIDDLDGANDEDFPGVAGFEECIARAERDFRLIDFNDPFERCPIRIDHRSPQFLRQQPGGQTVQAWTSHPLVHASVAKSPGCMESELHTDGFSNPGTGEIEELFKTVGMANVWVLFKAVEPDQLIAQSVNAIVHRRNQIAHGKADATITLADAKIYVERAERIAEVFEQLVTVEVNSRLALADCWLDLENATQ
jgi:hypothetical protein